MKKIYKTRLSFVIDKLNESTALDRRKILDVGFIGDYEEAVVHYKIVDSLEKSDILFGIDIDKEKLDNFLKNEKTKLLQEKYNLNYEVMSVFNTRFADQEIDDVLVLEVFEHLMSPYSALHEIHRIMKPGGKLIITYPNPLSFAKLIKFIFQKNLLDMDYLKMFRGAPDHKVFPHPICMANYLIELNYEIADIQFIKYDIRRLPLIGKLFERFNITRKFSSYIGFCAIKK